MINSIFEKKNAIYSLNEKNILPFEKEDLKIKSGQNIMSTSINRVFNNLVENDLYNEQLTKNIKNSTNIPGATVTGSPEAVKESRDGQKFVLTSNVEPHVIIGKREIEDIQYSISAVSDLSGMYINFIVSEGVDYIAGTMNGLYTSKYRDRDWRLINENDFLQKSFVGYNCKCFLANTFSIKSEYLNKYSYFLGTADGLFAFYMSGMDTYWFMLHPIKFIKSLILNKFDNLLYIVTENGLYWSDGLRFGLCNKTENLEINDIYILDNKELSETNSEILIGTTNGLKQSANGFYLSQIELLQKFESTILSIGKLDDQNGEVFVKLSADNDIYSYNILTYQPPVKSNIDPNLINWVSLDNITKLDSNISSQTSCIMNIDGSDIIVGSVISNDVENDLEYFALSVLSNLDKDLPELTFQTENKVEQIVKLSDNDYLFNDNMTLSVFSINDAGNMWVNIDLDSLNSLDLDYKFPIKNIMTIETKFDKNIIFSINKNLIICKSYHTEREFVYPYKDYSIFKTKFYNSNVKKIYPLNNDDKKTSKDRSFIIGCEKNTNYIRDLKMCIEFSDENGNIISGACGAVSKVFSEKANENKEKLLIAINNNIFKTFNNVQISYELSSLSPYSIITNIYPESDTKYNICTTNGLYITDKVYKIDDELRKFTISSIKDQINENLDPFIKMHLQEYHIDEDIVVESTGSTNNFRKYYMEELDKKAPAKLEFVPEGFTTTSPINVFNSIKIIKNDYVESIEFENNNSFIKASVSNWAAKTNTTATSIYSTNGFIDRFEIDGELFDLSKIPYIYKKWKSGMKEINLYVPSTMTYYINNPKGFSNSIYNVDSIERKNTLTTINIGNIISETSTKLKIILNNNHFEFTNISEIQINGNSLPLKIYKDDKFCQEGRENLFDTVIQPSLVESLPSIITENVNNITHLINEENELILNFSCYGTDSQSIKIIGE